MGLLSEAYSGLNACMSAQFAEHGVSAVEFEVLLRLARSPDHSLRMTDLATQTSLSTSGVTRVVDRLERDGLARRRACDSDRRISYTVITERGLARLRDVLPGHVALIEHWFTGLLPPDELAAVLAGLRKVRDAVRPGAVSGADEVPAPRGARAA